MATALAGADAGEFLKPCKGVDLQDAEEYTQGKRSFAEYKPAHQRFKVQIKGLQKQYSHIYQKRMLQQRAGVVAAARTKWGNAEKIYDTIISLRDDDKGILIGTLYKQGPMKPDVLADLAVKERGLAVTDVLKQYISEEDNLILEDAAGRIELVGDGMNVQESVTGVTMALKGKYLEDGTFNVEDMCVPGLPSTQQPRPKLTEGSQYAILVSGLSCGDEKCDPLLWTLLTDYITGHLGSTGEQGLSSKVVRLIVAGNSVHFKEQEAEAANSSFSKDSKKRKKQKFEHMQGPVQSLDLLLSQIAASVPVDLMPGVDDPSNYTMPQQPLHSCLFPSSSRYSTFKTVTNPYEMSVAGVSFAGHAGQPITDLRRNCTVKDHMRLHQNTLEWRHMAPTAPDTLACHPYYEVDPFVIEECPHVYFAGNQPAFRCVRVTLLSRCLPSPPR
jgi:DNA polymerase delta subunit 2